MIVPNYNYIQKNEKRLYKGVLYPFLRLHLEFDKNANSFGVSTVCFSYRYSLATNRGLRFLAPALVSAFLVLKFFNGGL